MATSINAKDDRMAPKKKHLIEAAPFGCLDQMLSTIVWGRVWGGFVPPAKNHGVWGQHPPAKFFRKNEKKSIFFFSSTLLTVPYFST